MLNLLFIAVLITFMRSVGILLLITTNSKLKMLLFLEIVLSNKAKNSKITKRMK